MGLVPLRKRPQGALSLLPHVGTGQEGATHKLGGEPQPELHLLVLSSARSQPP